VEGVKTVSPKPNTWRILVEGSTNTLSTVFLTLSGRGLKPSLGPLNGYRHIGDLMHSLSIGCKGQMPAMYESKIRISIAKIIQ
jgi:hypothetical protein